MSMGRVSGSACWVAPLTMGSADVRCWPRGDPLIQRGGMLYRQGALVSGPRLKTLPIGLHRGFEALMQAQVSCQQQGIANRDVGAGEAARADELIVRQHRLQRAPPGQDPASLALGHLGPLRL